MELRITDAAKDDIKFFLKSGQIGIVKKIEKLLIDIKKHPFEGIGKPEPLRHQYSGKWSRRIDIKNRVIYEVKTIQFLSIRLKAIMNNISRIVQTSLI